MRGICKSQSCKLSCFVSFVVFFFFVDKRRLMRSEAFKEKMEIAEKALNDLMSECPDYDDGDMLIEWVVTGYVSNPDPDKSGSRVIASVERMPSYRVRGLLHTALLMTDSEGSDDD